MFAELGRMKSSGLSSAVTSMSAIQNTPGILASASNSVSISLYQSCYVQHTQAWVHSLHPQSWSSLTRSHFNMQSPPPTNEAKEGPRRCQPQHTANIFYIMSLLHLKSLQPPYFILLCIVSADSELTNLLSQPFEYCITGLCYLEPSFLSHPLSVLPRPLSKSPPSLTLTSTTDSQQLFLNSPGLSKPLPQCH